MKHSTNLLTWRVARSLCGGLAFCSYSLELVEYFEIHVTDVRCHFDLFCIIFAIVYLIFIFLHLMTMCFWHTLVFLCCVQIQTSQW